MRKEQCIKFLLFLVGPAPEITSPNVFPDQSFLQNLLAPRHDQESQFQNNCRQAASPPSRLAAPPPSRPAAKRPRCHATRLRGCYAAN
jgi:hypothetical protein